MAHIHGSSSRTGTAGVVLTLPLGSFTTFVFSVTPQLQAALAVITFDTSAYFNLHTSTYPLGEVRGQLSGWVVSLSHSPISVQNRLIFIDATSSFRWSPCAYALAAAWPAFTLSTTFVLNGVANNVDSDAFALAAVDLDPATCLVGRLGPQVALAKESIANIV